MSGKLVILAGEKISEAAGLPSRAAPCRELLATMIEPDIQSEHFDDMRQYIQRRAWDDALSVAREGLGRHQVTYLIERYWNDENHPFPPIAELAPRLNAVITTCLHRVLDRAICGTWMSFAVVKGDLLQRHRYILKLRGVLGDQATWVLAREDCDQASLDWQRQEVLNTLFRAYTILFIGHGFRDGDTQRILSRIRWTSGQQPPTHFAMACGASNFELSCRLIEAAGGPRARHCDGVDWSPVARDTTDHVFTIAGSEDSRLRIFACQYGTLHTLRLPELPGA